MLLLWWPGWAELLLLAKPVLRPINSGEQFPHRFIVLYTEQFCLILIIEPLFFCMALAVN